jgi:predicted RecB family nuclease
VSGSTLGCVTAIEQPAPSRTGGVALDAKDLTRCRRRIHLDHDPDALGLPRALPDPALEQRRADAARHRAGVATVVMRETGCLVIPAGADAQRITAEAVAEGSALIWGALLPAAPGTRRAAADLLVRLPEGGYVPVVVVRHRITDPGEGAVTSSLARPWPGAAAADGARRVRSHPRDLLRLAHLHRLLKAAGWAPERGAPHGGWGGVIGFDADVVVWHDLWAGHWPGGRSTFTEYEVRIADRMAVATAAAQRAPALAQPSRITECRHCPWWPTCEAALTRAQDVSLVVRGEVAVGLRAAGISTVAALAAQDPRGELPVPGVPVADTVALARAWLRGLPVVRRVPRVPVRRADVEVDVDMESFGESGAYLWGALLNYPGGLRAGDESPGYRAFATWDPLPTPDEARSFAEFWAWLSGVRARAAASGRSFAAYCYNAHAENRWLLASAQRFWEQPGVPSVAEVEEFVADPAWVDIYAVVDEWFLCAHGKGLKRIAPAAGFGWRDTEAGGENSMRWYRDAVGLDGAPPDPAQRQRLLEYNADDVAATHALRMWMTSPAIDEVPLAAEL